MNKRIFLLGGVLLLLSSPIFSAAGGGGAVGRGASAASDDERRMDAGTVSDSEDDSSWYDREDRVEEDAFLEPLSQGKLNRALRMFKQFQHQQMEEAERGDEAIRLEWLQEKELKKFEKFINALGVYRYVFKKMPQQFNSDVMSGIKSGTSLADLWYNYDIYGKVNGFNLGVPKISYNIVFNVPDGAKKEEIVQYQDCINRDRNFYIDKINSIIRKEKLDLRDYESIAHLRRCIYDEKGAQEAEVQKKEYLIRCKKKDDDFIAKKEAKRLEDLGSRRSLVEAFRIYETHNLLDDLERVKNILREEVQSFKVSGNYYEAESLRAFIGDREPLSEAELIALSMREADERRRKILEITASRVPSAFSFDAMFGGGTSAIRGGTSATRESVGTHKRSLTEEEKAKLLSEAAADKSVRMFLSAEKKFREAGDLESAEECKRLDDERRALWERDDEERRVRWASSGGAAGGGGSASQ